MCIFSNVWELQSLCMRRKSKILPCLDFKIKKNKSINLKLCSSCCWQDDIELISFVPGFVFIIYLVWKLSLLRVILQISNMISFGYLSPLFLLVNINFLFQLVIEPQGAGLQLDFPFGNTQLVLAFPYMCYSGFLELHLQAFLIQSKWPDNELTSSP